MLRISLHEKGARLCLSNLETQKVKILFESIVREEISGAGWAGKAK